MKKRATVEYLEGVEVAVPAFGSSISEILNVAKIVYDSKFTATDEYKEGKNMHALLMTFNEEGAEVGYKFFKLYSKKEIIEYMKDKNPDNYDVDVFAPSLLKYDETYLEDNELYIINYIDYLDNDIITLFLKEEKNLSTRICQQ